MVSIRLRLLPTLLLVTLALAMSTTAAFAQYPPGVGFGAACTSESASAGDEVACAAEGAVAGETISWTVTAVDVIAEGTETADADGNAAFSFVVPALVEGERITVTVVGSESGEASTGVDVVVPIADTDDEALAESESALPSTGLELAVWVVGGLLLLGVGTSAVVAARRRQADRVDA